MIAGVYRRNPLDLEPYRVPLFDLSKNSHKWVHRGDGCGANAIAILTGLDTRKIISEKSKTEHFSDKFMVSFLRKRGFVVAPITQCEVSLDGSQNSIKNDHVVLMSQLLLKNEGSWTVCHKGQVYHNFCQHQIMPMEFLNRPILSAYVVFHPSWKGKKHAPKLRRTTSRCRW